MVVMGVGEVDYSGSRGGGGGRHAVEGMKVDEGSEREKMAAEEHWTPSSMSHPPQQPDMSQRCEQGTACTHLPMSQISHQKHRSSLMS